MHTSASMYANAACGWAERCHSVPSPLVGEGQGGGCNTHGPLFHICDPQMQPTVVLESVHETSLAVGALSPPLSLSLPHKGGGNRVARTFATHAMYLRLFFQRCVH